MRDKNTTFTVNEFVEFVNEKARKINAQKRELRRTDFEPSVSATSVRRWVKKGILPVEFYEETDVPVPEFGHDAIEWLIGPELAGADTGMTYTLNQLANATGFSDHTVRRHYKNGNITPVHLGSEFRRSPIFDREKVWAYFTSSAFDRALKASYPETYKEKQKRLAGAAPRKRDRSEYWKSRRLTDPGSLGQMGRDKKMRGFEPKTDHLLKFGDEEGAQTGYVPIEERIRRPDPAAIAADNARLIANLRGEPAPAPPQELPPAPEPAPTVDLDARLRAVEGVLSPPEYKFLVRGVTQLRTDGMSVSEQLAFVDEFMKSKDDEADEYEGEDDDD